MADETWKIAHLVGTSVQFAAGGGRKGLLGHDTTLGTLKMQLDALGNFAIYARRDAAQTFTGLQSFTNGIIDATLGVSLPVATDGSKRIVTLSAASFRTLTGTLATSLKGAANGLAELDSNGLVPSAQLPSYVDDVIEVADFAALPVTGEAGKIYVTLDNNLTYRWSGSAYVEISASLALGETSSTAYRGDRGATAYAHVSLTNNPHGTTAAQVGAVAKSGDTMTGLLNVPGLEDSTQTAGRLTYATTGGRLAGDAGLRRLETGGVTRSVFVGNGTTALAYVAVDSLANGTAYFQIQKAGVDRFRLVLDAANTARLQTCDASGVILDDLLAASIAAGGAITLGGSAATKRDVYVTKGLNIASLTASQIVATDGSKNLVSWDSATARTNLGLVIGTDVQAYDADLAAIAALTTTAFGRGLLTQTDAATFRTTIDAAQTSHSHSFASLTSKPTTLGGYGITDAIAASGVTICSDADILNPNGSFQCYGTVSNPACVGLASGSDGSGASLFFGRTPGAGEVTVGFVHGGVMQSDLIFNNIVSGGRGFIFKQAVANSGWVDAEGGFRRNGVQVVGSRNTGWTAITGTATKGGWDTATAGLTECKQTIKALYDAMAAHGLIGT